MNIVRIDAKGHLMTASLAQLLAEATTKLEDGPNAILMTTKGMTGYDMECQSIFIRWAKEHNDRVRRIAIASQRTIWSLVVSTMAPMISVDMAVFRDEEDALIWLERP